jgi:hypothetical protein
MSWVVEIVIVPVADDPNEAWEQLEELREEEVQREYSTPPSPPLHELYSRLTARYPCIIEDPNSPWSDGPLINNFGEKIATLGISVSRMTDVLSFVVKTATEMGFTVFDGGDETIHRPQGGKPPAEWSIPKPAPQRRPWTLQKLWLLLLCLAVAGIVVLSVTWAF